MEMKKGHPQKQAIAMALAAAGKSKGKGKDMAKNKGKVVVKGGVAKDQRGMSKAAQKKHEKAEPFKKKVAETKKYGAS